MDDEIVSDLEAAYVDMGLSSGVSPNNKRPRRVGRNEPCVCGSGKKFKRCCFSKSKRQIGTTTVFVCAFIAVAVLVGIAISLLR